MPQTERAPARTLSALTTSPIGDLLLTSDGEALTGLHMSPHEGRPELERESGRGGVLEDVIGQLRSYFAGELTAFDVELRPEGTTFQMRVWAELSRIPYGETISYGELARRVGRENGFRAVGQANGRNPISIIVPCHRVIGADGSLTGYGGGAARKRFLLDLESAPRRLL